MASQLFRTGDLVTLDDFHRELLASMLNESVPSTLPVGQAQELVARVKALSSGGMAYGALLGGMLKGLDAVLGLAVPADEAPVDNASVGALVLHDIARAFGVVAAEHGHLPLKGAVCLSN